ncbi:MAG: VWD domain-containing protein [Myxococcales bacterium]
MKRSLGTLTLCVALAPLSARAWDSYCDDATGACPSGIAMASQRWRSGEPADTGESDEHRRLFEWVFADSGIPPTMNDLAINIYTSQDDWFLPSPFSRVETSFVHQRSVSEFSQLPDYGYALSDWASQFSTCPPEPGRDPAQCHAFDNHMGTLNSNHFLPQAENFYRHYHQLALQKAESCAQVSDQLGTRASEFGDFLRECDREALIIEAVGQHYLQDAWSSGHMWERWGTPEFSELPAFPSDNADSRLFNGLTVALIAGAIHGSQAKLHLPDPLCSEDDRVEFVQNGQHYPAVGDLYRNELLSDDSFAYQRSQLYTCSLSGMTSVYAASSHIDAPNYAESGGSPGAECFDQRATNRAMSAGFGAISKVTGLMTLYLQSQHETVPVDDVVAVKQRLNSDLEKIAARLEMAEEKDAYGTQMATGGLRTLLNVKPNSGYPAASSSPPASYVDPELAWPVNTTGPSTVVEELPFLFNLGHAAEWCAELSKQDLEGMRERSRSAGAGTPAHRLCVDFARRHVRRLAPDEKPEAEKCPGEETEPQDPKDKEEDEKKKENAFCRALNEGSALLEVKHDDEFATNDVLADTWCLSEDEEKKEDGQSPGRDCDHGKGPGGGGGTGGGTGGDGGGTGGNGGSGGGTGGNGGGTGGNGGGTGGNGGGTDGDGGGTGGNGGGTGGNGGGTGGPGGGGGGTGGPGGGTGGPGGDPGMPYCLDDCGLDLADPHLLTYDGLAYDFMDTGEFVASLSDDDSLEIQVRYAVPGRHGSRTVMGTALGFRVEGHRVSLYAPYPNLVYIDGQRFEFDESHVEKLSGTAGASVELDVKESTWTVRWSDGSFVSTDRNPVGHHAMMKLSEVHRGAVRGLLGNFDGDPMNDVLAEDGQPVDTSSTDQPGVYAVPLEVLNAGTRANYRVPEGRSLFDLPDVFFPAPMPTTAPPTPEQEKAAAATCAEAGLVAGYWYDACVYDLARMGDMTDRKEWARSFLGAPTPEASLVILNDRDGDGLDAAAELLLLTDPERADTDGDGISDGLEVAAETDPNDEHDEPARNGDSIVDIVPGQTFTTHLPIPTSIEKSDVYILMDVTGSMGGSLSSIRSAFSGPSGILERVRSEMPNAMFGIGQFSDYNESVPAYKHLQDITPDASAVQTALDGLHAGGGGDNPEALIPALWSMASGKGLGAGSSWELARGEKGSPFAPCPATKWGFPCFREAALPIVVAVTDVQQHNGPGGKDAYSFAAPSYDQAVDELIARGTKVVGVVTTSAALQTLEPLASDTGAVDAAGHPLVTRVSSSVNVGAQVASQVISVARAPHDLTLLVDDEASDPNQPAAWLKELSPLPEGDAELRCQAHSSLLDANSDGQVDTFSQVVAGDPVCYSAMFVIGDLPRSRRPTAFLLNLRVYADGSEVATRRLWLMVPAAPNAPERAATDSLSTANRWLDTDGDTISDADEGGMLSEDSYGVDTDGDGNPDFLDPDSDNDGLTDAQEAGDALLETAPFDTDKDGTADFRAAS